MSIFGKDHYFYITTKMAYHKITPRIMLVSVVFIRRQSSLYRKHSCNLL